jgi:hypothetical protein
MFTNIVLSHVCACARVSACTYARVPMRVCALRTRVCTRVRVCVRVHMRPQKSQKIGLGQPKIAPHPSKKNPFPDPAIARRLAIVPKSYSFLIFFISL